MNVILGGGLSGLAAGHRLTEAGCPAIVVEKGSRVGGLARTIEHGKFRFDLGGHRFLTDNQRIMSLVSDLLGDDLLTVPRSSQIYMHGRFVDYPLSPLNAVFGLGLSTTSTILLDYIKERFSQTFCEKELVSLEDWVVAQFGRKMFDLYFREYSEKVWGIGCDEISMEWVEKRIDGLSLWKAIKQAFLKARRSGFKTLTDSFVYPRLGIGQLSDRLAEFIMARNSILRSTDVQKVYHADGMISGIEIKDGKGLRLLRGSNFLSSIPLTLLVEKMCPGPPEYVSQALEKIGFRSLVVVCLMLDRSKATDLSWLYFPGNEIPFGRIHEPNNWSREMSPPGKSQIVAEYFCDHDDSTWNSMDEELAATATEHLQRLSFFEAGEVSDSLVMRVPFAYPVFNIDYRENLEIITSWLERFNNLHLIGRSGSYSYLNMDCAMASGIETAEKVMSKSGAMGSITEQMAALPSYL